MGGIMCKINLKVTKQKINKTKKNRQPKLKLLALPSTTLKIYITHIKAYVFPQLDIQYSFYIQIINKSQCSPLLRS